MSIYRLYLTTHMDNWLSDPEADFPMCVSDRRLKRRKNLKRSTHPWFQDSGGFTELQKHGVWEVSPEEYVRRTARHDREIGNMEWAAAQDSMCERIVITGGVAGGQKFAGTPWFRQFIERGMDAEAAVRATVRVHQRLTVTNFLQLRELWPQESDTECPYMPTLQGDLPWEYHACRDLYEQNGVRLADYPVVGLGSVCRRQATGEIAALIRELSVDLALHGFGVKTLGLARSPGLLESSDTAAWSVDGRRKPPMPGHTHKNCANCLPFAKAWRARTLGQLGLAA